MSVGIRVARGKTGPQGPTGPAGGSSGRSYYFANSVASDVATYKVAQLLPSASAESTIVTANTGTGYTLNAVFATIAGEPGVLSLPLGSAFALLYAKVDGGVASVKLEVYKRVLAGTETLLRSYVSSSFSNLDVRSIDEVYTDAGADALLATDRLVFKIYTARVSGPTAVTTTLYFEGSAHAAQIATTIGFATIAGDVTGDTGNTVVGKLLGTPLDPSVGTVGLAQDGDVLTWNNDLGTWVVAHPTVGAVGPAGPPGGTQGRRYYLDMATASDIGGAYKVASLTPSAGAETSVTQANTGTSFTLVATFATLSGEPGVLSLPAGTATSYLYARVNTGVGSLKFELYKRAAGGTETLLRTSTSPNISSTVPALVQFDFTDASGYALLSTDRLVFKVYTARVSGATTVSVTFYCDGTDHASSVETTILNTSTTGGIIRTVAVAKTANYTLLGTDHEVPFDVSAGSLTATLMASAETGREFKIAVDGTCGTPYRLTIDGNGVNIDGFGTTWVWASPWQARTFTKYPTYWKVS